MTNNKPRGGKYLRFCAVELTHVPARKDALSPPSVALFDFDAAHAQPFTYIRGRPPHPSSHSITPTQNVRISKDSKVVSSRRERERKKDSCCSRVHVVHSVPFPFLVLLTLSSSLFPPSLSLSSFLLAKETRNPAWYIFLSCSYTHTNRAHVTRTEVHQVTCTKRAYTVWTPAEIIDQEHNRESTGSLSGSRNIAGSRPVFLHGRRHHEEANLESDRQFDD